MKILIRKTKRPITHLVSWKMTKSDNICKVKVASRLGGYALTHSGGSVLTRRRGQPADRLPSFHSKRVAAFARGVLTEARQGLCSSKTTQWFLSIFWCLWYFVTVTGVWWWLDQVDVLKNLLFNTKVTETVPICLQPCVGHFFAAKANLCNFFTNWSWQLML